ncbi:MAG: bifunctional DNA-formamidopyrimidine glycosylase/DNA-(apurinic or apyrimidinic site) lyase [Betaproteobacteria bacterium]|nr:bifunctional DNA-formamidopyrimidine glycosylase/DNA-(apurinic or apyrimidinic site) lyase [Betaproteobacteria bacterium]
MPELPEVETVRRGLVPLLTGRRVSRVTVRHRGLRWPVAANFERELETRAIVDVDRRGKYLLVNCNGGTLIVHLGMSGSLRVVPAATPADRHDHLDLVLDDGRLLRFNDPRRFGSVHWVTDDPLTHPLLAGLGPEPLAPGFDGDSLYVATRTRSAAIKLVLMDSHVLAGIGNIYASEALYRARIHPARSANRVSLERYRRLAQAIHTTLELALAAGGSTLRDFVDAHGAAGCFQQQYTVYGRTGEPCHHCGSAIRSMRQGQRSTFYCPRCQR